MTLVDPTRAHVLTRLIRSDGDQVRTTHSPLTGEPVADIPQSSIADVDAAFEAARAAQRLWATTDLAVRQAALLRLHDLVLDHADELMDLIQIESGKSRRDAHDEVSHVALTARYHGRRLPKILRTTKRTGVLPGLTGVTVRQVPKGVVGVISPWNYPLTMALSDGLAAIAAGNAVVLKPDSQSPLIALAGVELLRKAGFPIELWQVVCGAGSVIGTAITERADYICFTGSTATGTVVARTAADRLVSCSLELGGKNPMIVLPGADVEKAAATAVRACFGSAGQLCVSIERLYVPAGLYVDFRDAFVRRTSAIALGAGLDWDADMGSLVSASQLATVTEHIADAVSHGASVATGGRARPDLGPFFHEPTVLENVTEEAVCFAEETFGPVVSLYPYETIEQAVELANAGDYGLNASIVGPEALAVEVAPQITAGTVNVNEGYAATFGSIDAPMGGMRRSGVGRRQGAEGVLRFTEPQAIAVQRGIPVTGPDSIPAKVSAKALTGGLRVLRRTRRA